MSSRRPPEPPTSGRTGTARRSRGLARRAGAAGLLLAGAALLGACSSPWTAPASTVVTPGKTTYVPAPVPKGGGTLTITNPLAYQTQSPGRAVPSGAGANAASGN